MQTSTKPPFLFIAIFSLLSIFTAMMLLLWLNPTASVENVPPPPQLVIDPSSLDWSRVDFASSTHWSRRDSHAVYPFNGKLWVAGGVDADDTKVNGIPVYENSTYYNDIWSSPDGLVWTKEVERANFPKIRSQSVIAFKGTLYMYGGWSPEYGVDYKTGIWRSTDGLTWEQVVAKPDYPDREGQKVFEFKNKLWLVGGVNYFAKKTFNDVWSSDDGLHWSLVTKNAPWHSRWDHDVGVFKNKLWIAGGMNFAGVGYGDVWSSEDGATWTEVTPLAPWGKRQGQEIVTYRGYMWLVSGLDSATNEGEGDTWYTADGVSWEKVPQDDKWLGREDHAVTVFQDKIWVLGGMDSEWHWNDDIWYSNFSKVPKEVLDNRRSTTAATTTATTSVAQ